MKKVEKTELSLKNLIPMYAETKAEVDEYDKTAKKLSRDIKALMAKLLKKDEKSVDAEAGGYVANYSIRTSVGFNEDALLEFMHKHKQFTSCIKTKEYVDADILEDLIYKGDIPKKLLLELDKFKTEKKTEYLTVKRKEG